MSAANKSDLFENEVDALDFAANSGHVDAMLVLALACEVGGIVEKNSSKAIEYVEEAARAGSPLAMYVLARHILNVTDTSPEKALFWSKKAAELGFAPAIFLQAQIYEKGEGVNVNHAKAEDLYREAAKAGLGQAAAYLSYVYAQGLFGKQDLPAAVSYARQASEAGNALATSYLADCYLDGIGIKANSEEAVRLYELAAERGNRMAALCLSMIYSKGMYGIAEDKEKSEYYLALCETNEQNSSRSEQKGVSDK